MGLIKINTEHYVVVDKTIQPVNGYYYDSFINKIKNTNSAEYGEASHCWQITHSTQPFELSSENGLSGMVFSKVRPLNIFEVKELLGEVDVEKKSYQFIKEIGGTREQRLAYIDGYREALEDNKDRKYTEKDIDKAYWAGMQFVGEDKGSFGEFIQSLQPKKEWEVEMVDGKLKLI